MEPSRREDIDDIRHGSGCDVTRCTLFLTVDPGRSCRQRSGLPRCHRPSQAQSGPARASQGSVRPSQAQLYTAIHHTSVLYIASKHVHFCTLGVFLSPTGGSGSGSRVGPHSILSRCQSDHPREDTGSPSCAQVQSLVSCLVPCIHPYLVYSISTSFSQAAFAEMQGQQPQG